MTLQRTRICAFKLSFELAKSEQARMNRQSAGGSNRCFNCGKFDHCNRDCTLRKNMITTEWHREMMMSRKDQHSQKLHSDSKRYHDEQNEISSRVRIGILPTRIRQILGMGEDEIPSYIYRLREHGYPKGWLKKATINPSKFNMYDAHGNEISDPNMEEGEVCDEKDRIRYDLSKLVEFPGFNTPLPENFTDDYEIMNAPRYDPDQDMTNMIELLSEKKMTDSYNLSRNSDANTNNDTISDFGDQNDSIISANVKKQNKHKDNSSNDIDSSLRSSSTEENDELEGRLSAVEKNAKGNEETLPKSRVQCEEDSTGSGAKKENLGRILGTTPGTPLLLSNSGFDRLPPPENFSKNIADVINFENLPESTGKYDKMRELLLRIRNDRLNSSSASAGNTSIDEMITD